MKAESRVPKGYKKGTSDWSAEYNMLLDDGVTCGDCMHAYRCRILFGGDDGNTKCQFHPSRFQSVK